MNIDLNERLDYKPHRLTQSKVSALLINFHWPAAGQLEKKPASFLCGVEFTTTTHLTTSNGRYLLNLFVSVYKTKLD